MRREPSLACPQTSAMMTIVTAIAAAVSAIMKAATMTGTAVRRALSKEVELAKAPRRRGWPGGKTAEREPAESQKRPVRSTSKKGHPFITGKASSNIGGKRPDVVFSYYDCRMDDRRAAVDGRGEGSGPRGENALRDRARGMFVGLAVGDAAGMPVEFKEPGEFEPVEDLRAGGPFNLPRGYWTDDTSMALCLADSLLSCEGYDSYDVMSRYRRWWREGYRSSTGTCFDIGNQVTVAVLEFERESWVPRGKPRVKAAGNGSIMRLAPAVIAAFDSRTPERIVETAGITARETHYSVEAEIGTEVFAAMLVRAMQGADKADVLAPTDMSTGKRFDEILNRVTDVDKLANTGYVIYSLQVAAWAFSNYESFREGMLAAVNLGGDSDTNGAIYGQLAGAYYGYEGIPGSWRDGVYMGSEIAVLADDLLAMKTCPVLQTRFEED